MDRSTAAGTKVMTRSLLRYWLGNSEVTLVNPTFSVAAMYCSHSSGLRTFSTSNAPSMGNPFLVTLGMEPSSKRREEG